MLTPERQSTRTTYGLFANYMAWGTDFPTAYRLSDLKSFLRDVEVTPAPPTERDLKPNLIGWAHYELGLATFESNPFYASRQFSHALRDIRCIPSDNVTRKEEHLRYRKSIALIRLQRDVASREVGGPLPNFKRTIGTLGKIVLDGTRQAANETLYARSSAIMGVVAEAAMDACALLPSMDSPERGILPVAVSPRQDAPRAWVTNEFNQKLAVDMNLLVSNGRKYGPLRAIPVQVKCADYIGSDSAYDESILMLYAKRELFLDTTEEYEHFGESLKQFSEGMPSRTLEIARSNLDLAIDLHLEEHPFDSVPRVYNA